MLKITEELLIGLKQDNIPLDILPSYIISIIKFGSKRDCDILFEYYLSKPFDFKSSYLFSLFKKFGDELYFEKLFQIFTKNPKIVEEEYPELLGLLATFKNDSIKEILKKYALEDANANYHLCQQAVLGLLNFDCIEYEKIIEEKIVECYNKNLFPEYVPALVCKLKNKEKILDELFVLGNEYASIDCNAGIVLGFSLCGDIGKKYFMKALSSPHWEVDCSGTGTTQCAYKGMKNLGISFEELYTIIKKEDNIEQLEHLLAVLFSLLQIRVKDYDKNIESFMQLYQILFDYCEKDNLIELAMKVDKDEQAYALREIIELKMTEELLLRNCQNYGINRCLNESLCVLLNP